MKVPKPVINIVLVAVLLWHAWLFLNVVELKVTVAVLRAKIHCPHSP